MWVGLQSNTAPTLPNRPDRDAPGNGLTQHLKQITVMVDL